MVSLANGSIDTYTRTYRVCFFVVSCVYMFNACVCYHCMWQTHTQNKKVERNNTIFDASLFDIRGHVFSIHILLFFADYFQPKNHLINPFRMPIIGIFDSSNAYFAIETHAQHTRSTHSCIQNTLVKFKTVFIQLKLIDNNLLRLCATLLLHTYTYLDIVMLIKCFSFHCIVVSFSLHRLALLYSLRLGLILFFFLDFSHPFRLFVYVVNYYHFKKRTGLTFCSTTFVSIVHLHTNQLYTVKSVCEICKQCICVYTDFVSFRFVLILFLFNNLYCRFRSV